ncbi:hypothetical protein D7Y09_10955 [bacterium 1XD42-1]|nr:hypothetical protein D7X25_09810 [bacterium 1XD42-8]RKJ63673.1 hypothetical protein D7Y09_10955 [bacterium 1XD42-1]
MDFGTGSFPIVLNFVWSLLFSLFYHEKGAMNKCFVYFLFFKRALTKKENTFRNFFQKVFSQA